ncbi:MAG: ABC transporter ATP-binding protein, partial [Moraxellaceae bacterium]
LLLISHDRAFVDQVVTSTWVFDGKGAVEEYIGGYQDYLFQRDQQRLMQAKKSASSDSHKDNVKTQKAKSGEQPVVSKKVKLSYKEQRELDTLPEEVASLEAEQEQLSAKLADGSWFNTDAQAANQAITRLAEIEKELMDKLDRWTQLEAASQGE